MATTQGWVIQGLTWWEKFPHHPVFLLLQQELPWELVSATTRFKCKDLTAVKTELDEMKIRNCNNNLTQHCHQHTAGCGFGAYNCGNHNGLAKRFWWNRFPRKFISALLNSNQWLEACKLFRRKLPPEKVLSKIVSLKGAELPRTSALISFASSYLRQDSGLQFRHKVTSRRVSWRQSCSHFWYLFLSRRHLVCPYCCRLPYHGGQQRQQHLLQRRLVLLSRRQLVLLLSLQQLMPPNLNQLFLSPKLCPVNNNNNNSECDEDSLHAWDS